MANKHPTKTGKETGMKHFGDRGQPDPQLKREGRARKKNGQLLADMMLLYQGMTMKEVETKFREENQGDLTLGQLAILNYMKEVVSGKQINHYLDIHISKAPTQVTGDDGPIEIDLRSASIDDLLKIIKQR